MKSGGSRRPSSLRFHFLVRQISGDSLGQVRSVDDSDGFSVAVSCGVEDLLEELVSQQFGASETIVRVVDHYLGEKVETARWGFRTKLKFLF